MTERGSGGKRVEVMIKSPNAFEAEAVRLPTISSLVRAPRGATRR